MNIEVSSSSSEVFLNTFIDGSDRTVFYDGDTTKACIYSKDDLTIKGNGTLNVTGNFNNGIHTSNDLRFKDAPTIIVNAKNHAIKGKGSVEFGDETPWAGNIEITSTEGDGIKSDEGEEETFNAEKGFIHITVSKSYEGFEAYVINLNGGTTSIVASDDGWNAAGGDGSGTTTGGSTSTPSWGGGGGFSSSTGTLNVKGGYHFVKAGGDGLDSNGDFNISGGTTIVLQTGGGGNGILDMGDGSGYKMTHSGGVVLGLGTSQMFVTPNSGTYISSTSLGASQNSMICIASSSGQVLAAFKTPLSAAAGIYMDNNISGHKFYIGGTFNGTLDSNGFATIGTISGATQK
jgi:hypothetical protein